MTVEVVAVVVAAAVLGGAVQATLGFGGSFVLVPAVAVLVPEALPAAVLLGLLPLTTWVAWRDRAAVDRTAFVRISLARIPGIVAATAVVALAPERVLTFVIAGVLLVAVAATTAGWSIRPSGTVPDASRVDRPARLSCTWPGPGNTASGWERSCGRPGTPGECPG